MNLDGNLVIIDDILDVINNFWCSGFIFCDVDGVFEIYDVFYVVGIVVVFFVGNDGLSLEIIILLKFNNWDLVWLFLVGNFNVNNLSLIIFSGFSCGLFICGGIGFLFIKLEVFVLGFIVWLVYVGGEYFFLLGIFMAVLYVLGVILLFKEVFFYFIGEDLMLVFYFFVIDFGLEGEDNDYGMGIINLFVVY